MTVYVKSGGAWRAATNGRLWIKSGGAWRVANYCYIKSGGIWRDSNYRGFPAAPTGLYVTAWDLVNVSCAFYAGSGGAPVDHWVAEKLNAGGTVVASQNTSGTFTFGVTQDEYCQFRVYAVSTGGITSRPSDGGPGYSNTVRTLIGHTETGYWTSEGRSRAWQNNFQFQGGIYRQQVVAINVPAAVTMTQWYLRTWLNFNSTYLSKPPAQGNRQMYYYYNNTAQYNAFDIGTGALGNQDNEQWIPIGSNGANGNWGIWIDGIGWSPLGQAGSQLMCGVLYIYGNELYYVDVWVITRNALGNQYW